MKNSKPSRLTKLRASIVKRYNLAFHSGYSVETAYDRRFLIDWRHPVDKKIAFQMFEHERLMNFMGCVVRIKPDLFLDVGAHSGLYSILVNSKCPGAEIHAFEPDSTNLGQLHANLFLNRLCDQVVVHPYGASDHDGVLGFAASCEHGHRAFSKVSVTGSVKISVKRIDSVLQVEGGRIALKIDVEGHELAVLRGAEGLLRKNSCYMQMESSEENFGDAKSLLESMGYRWLGSDGDHYFTNLPDFMQ